MRVLIPFLAVVLASGCTAINPDCDAAVLACYAKNPDDWESVCLPRDMAPAPGTLGSPCSSNDECKPVAGSSVVCGSFASKLDGGAFDRYCCALSLPGQPQFIDCAGAGGHIWDRDAGAWKQ